MGSKKPENLFQTKKKKRNIYYLQTTVVAMLVLPACSSNEFKNNQNIGTLVYFIKSKF